MSQFANQAAFTLFPCLLSLCTEYRCLACMFPPLCLSDLSAEAEMLIEIESACQCVATVLLSLRYA